jgi:diguanylate cyclase (GGDEF)-like protein/PAS domain S-box-containing protein
LYAEMISLPAGAASSAEVGDGGEALARAVLDSLTAEIAVLDARGSILAVNEEWRRFARTHGGDDTRCYVGDSYLAACEDAMRRGEDGSVDAVLTGLKELLAGNRQSLRAEYPCHTPTEERWFVVRATTISAKGTAGRVVVSHQEVTERRRAENVLREMEQRLRAVLEALPVGVWIMDGSGRIVLGNGAGQRIWAGARYVGPDEFGEYKGWWLDTGKPIAAHDWAAARAIERGETSIDEEIEIECFDGTRKVILNSALPLLDTEGRVNGAIIVNQDVTARMRGEAALRESEEKWRKLFSILPVGVSIIDEERNIVEMNPALERVLRISAAGLAAGAYRHRRYFRADGTTIGLEDLPSARALREKKTVEDVEIGIATEDGEELWTSISAAPLPLPDGRAVVVTSDITPRKRVERALRQAKDESDAANRRLQEVLRYEQLLARTDPLTGVANRRRFFDIAAHEFAGARRYGRPLAIVLFDVDRFKQVNDALGHEAGDRVLKDVARRAAGENLRDVDVLARYGGEEFVVLLPGCEAAQAAMVAERIRAAISARPVETERGPVTVTISAGVAVLLPEDDGVGPVIQRADRALYAAKTAGRNRVVSAG